MKQEIINAIELTDNDNDKEKYRVYLRYLGRLTQRDCWLLEKLEFKIKKRANLVCEEFKDKVWELLFWELCFEDFCWFLNEQLLKYKEEDSRKEDSWLSWEMWRLAIIEYDDSKKDAPILRNEIEELRKIIYW